MINGVNVDEWLFTERIVTTTIIHKCPPPVNTHYAVNYSIVYLITSWSPIHKQTMTIVVKFV